MARKKIFNLIINALTILTFFVCGYLWGGVVGQSQAQNCMGLKLISQKGATDLNRLHCDTAGGWEDANPEPVQVSPWTLYGGNTYYVRLCTHP